MRGPRSIAESVASTQHGRFSTSASISALNLNTGNAGLRPDESLLHFSGEGINARLGSAHHPSAQAMVEKYERMCKPLKGSSLGRAKSPRDPPVVPPKGEVSEVTGKKDKSRSPIRQSIRNLLSAIKKGAARSGEVIVATRSPPKVSMNTVVLNRAPRMPDRDEDALSRRVNERSSGYTLSRQLQAESPTGALPSWGIGSGAAGVPTYDQGKADFSGPVWHLSASRPLGNSRPLAPWALCTGVIKSRKLTATWPTYPGASVLELDLSRCLDVRSLENAELEKEELASLSSQDETRELKVFEIVLQGREKEIFAVRNLGERAAWISALWDSILTTERSEKWAFGSQNELVQRPAELNSSTPARNTLTAITHSTAMNGEPTPSSVIEGDAFLSKRREQSLPPLPFKNPRMLPPITIPTSLISKVDIMPRIDSARTHSPSMYSPCSSPPPPSCTRTPPVSPSIAALGQRSMVKMRLAKIQKEQTLTSPCLQGANRLLSPCSPASTTGTGRSGFLSILTAGEDTNTDIVEERTPFGYLRESRLFESPQLPRSLKPRYDLIMEDVGSITDTRPVLERSDSARSELPYANDEIATGGGPRFLDQLEETIKPLFQDLTTVKNALGGETGQPTLHHMLRGIDDRSRSTKRTVEELVRKFESLQAQTLASGEPRRSSCEASGSLSSCTQTREALEKTRSDITNRIDALMDQLTKMNNNEPRLGTQPSPPACTLPQEDPSSPVLTKIREHIDDALSVQLTSLRERTTVADLGSYPAVADELAKLKTLVESDKGQHALQVQQQADSVRYLNELNSWLENFVRHGTAQINGLATNIDHLCRDLGSGRHPSNGGVLNDIRAMLLELKTHGDTSAIQASVDKLTETISRNPQDQMDPQALASFMKRQRQEQEAFLRAFTAEISGEIKGERLRFVEAMKEATVINVQMQVDQLKKELAQQVVTLTHELGRLESEKCAVETKIANLHAFHANQKQAVGAHAPLTVTAARQTYRPFSHQPQFQAYAGYQRRPLPYPQ